MVGNLIAHPGGGYPGLNPQYLQVRQGKTPCLMKSGELVQVPVEDAELDGTAA